MYYYHGQELKTGQNRGAATRFLQGTTLDVRCSLVICRLVKFSCIPLEEMKSNDAQGTFDSIVP